MAEFYIGEKLTASGVFYDLDNIPRTDLTVDAVAYDTNGSTVLSSGTATRVGNAYQYEISAGQNDAAGTYQITLTPTTSVNVAPIMRPFVFVVEGYRPAVDSSGRVAANVTQISGDATAADNAEAFFDGTGYAGTNNVIPTVTTLTNPVTAGTVSDKTGYGLADNAITAAKINDGALTAAKFASGAFDAVWSVATRTLTAISDSAGITTLLSRLTSTRAGNLDNLDATVNSRLASSSYTAPDNSGVAAIKAKTDQFAFTTPNKVDASATISGTLDANVVQISGSTTAADNLRKSLLTTRAGTVLAGSTATSILTDLTESTTDLFKSRIIVFYSGGAAYATGDVTGYNGTTKTLTVSGLSVTPSTSDAFILL